MATAEEVEQKRLHLVGAMAVGLVEPKKPETVTSLLLKGTQGRVDA